MEIQRSTLSGGQVLDPPISLESSSSVTAVNALSLREKDEKDDLSRLDPSRAKAIDLSEIRKNTKLDFSPALIISCIFIVGWLAVAVLKIRNEISHYRAESRLASGTTKENLQEAIKVAGPLRWQYQLELAKLHLVAGEIDDADNLLRQVRNQRGETLSYPPPPINAVSYREVHFNPGTISTYGLSYGMKLEYHSFEEAMLHVMLFSAQRNYTEAYEALNEVGHYNPQFNFRLLQAELVKKMTADNAGSRTLEILKKEKEFANKFNTAKAEMD